MVLVKLALQVLARELPCLFCPFALLSRFPPQEIREQVTGRHAHAHLFLSFRWFSWLRSFLLCVLPLCRVVFFVCLIRVYAACFAILQDSCSFRDHCFFEACAVLVWVAAFEAGFFVSRLAPSFPLCFFALLRPRSHIKLGRIAGEPQPGVHAHPSLKLQGEAHLSRPAQPLAMSGFA